MNAPPGRQAGGSTPRQGVGIAEDIKKMVGSLRNWYMVAWEDEELTSTGCFDMYGMCHDMYANIPENDISRLNSKGELSAKRILNRGLRWGDEEASNDDHFLKMFQIQD